MNNNITNRQMFFIIFMTLTTYTTIDISTIMAKTAGRSSWIPIIMTSFLFGIAIVIITKLNNMYVDKTFYEYSQEIVGKSFSRVIALYFIFYFVIIGVYLKLKLVNLLSSDFLPKTPKFILLLVAIPIFAYAVNKGVSNVARMAEIYGVLFLIVTIVMCIFMILGGIKYNIQYNILPFYNPSEVKEFAKTMKELIVPYGGIEILLIMPFTKENKNAPKVAFFTLLFVGLVYVLIVESTMMILGINNTILLNDSFIEAIKLTEGPVIERVDIFYLTFGLASLFSGKIIIFTGAVEFTCRLFSKVKRYIIVIIIGIIYFVMSWIFLKIKDVETSFGIIGPYLILISDFLIPMIFYLLVKVKKNLSNKS